MKHCIFPRLSIFVKNYIKGMSVMGKQITLGQLLSILASILIPVVGYMVNLGIDQASLKRDVENNKGHIKELKEDRKETNKKLDTIIEITTALKVQMTYKQDKKPE